jgi:DNA repair protein RecO (recombination protein O)
VVALVSPRPGNRDDCLTPFMTEYAKTTGIVLRHSPVTESSLIVTWLTRDFGKVRTIAKGARRTKSPFRGRVEPFHLDELVFLRSRRSDLHILHEVSILEPHRRLREDLKKLHTALYFCELADLATAPEHGEPRLFALLEAALAFLDANPPHPLLLCWFEINLLAALGFDPAARKKPVAPDLLRLFQHLRQLGPGQLSRLKLSPPQAAALEAFFLEQCQHQFARLPRARRFAR